MDSELLTLSKLQLGLQELQFYNGYFVFPPGKIWHQNQINKRSWQKFISGPNYKMTPNINIIKSKVQMIEFLDMKFESFPPKIVTPSLLLSWSKSPEATKSIISPPVSKTSHKFANMFQIVLPGSQGNSDWNQWKYQPQHWQQVELMGNSCQNQPAP